MKKIINVNRTSDGIDIALLVARVGIAGLMLTHGIPKLMMLLSGGPVQFPGMLGMNSELTLSLAIFAEVFCSILILTGFATRFATVPLISTMLVAVLLVHSADPFAVKESALNYLIGYTVLLFAGSGKYSVDYLLSRNSNYRTKQDPSPSLVLINQ